MFSVRRLLSLRLKVSSCTSRLCLSSTTSTSSPSREAVAAFYLSDKYGLTAPPSNDEEFAKGMITALASAAFGDGDFSESEKKWIRGHFLTLNYPEEFVDSSLNDSAMNISSVVLLMQNPKLERAKKILIYDAIRAASSDHMKESELNMIAKLAYLMDITKEDFDQIVRLVEEEEALKLKRIDLLGFKSFSMLAPKYK